MEAVVVAAEAAAAAVAAGAVAARPEAAAGAGRRGGGGGATSAGTLVFTLTFATCGEPVRAGDGARDRPGDASVRVRRVLLFVELPRKYAAANAAAPIATAMRRILTGLLIPEARL